MHRLFATLMALAVAGCVLGNDADDRPDVYTFSGRIPDDGAVWCTIMGRSLDDGVPWAELLLSAAGPDSTERVWYVANAREWPWKLLPIPGGIRVCIWFAHRGIWYHVTIHYDDP